MCSPLFNFARVYIPRRGFYYKLYTPKKDSKKSRIKCKIFFFSSFFFSLQNYGIYERCCKRGVINFSYSSFFFFIKIFRIKLKYCFPLFSASQGENQSLAFYFFYFLFVIIKNCPGNFTLFLQLKCHKIKQIESREFE